MNGLGALITLVLIGGGFWAVLAIIDGALDAYKTHRAVGYRPAARVGEYRHGCPGCGSDFTGTHYYPVYDERNNPGLCPYEDGDE